ncbi:MAG: GPP34 family phosphoprotein [Kineosporiaceae bacterium]
MLADDAYWLFHDDRSGRSRIPSRVAGTALAAAVLAELAAEGLLVVTSRVVRPTPAARPSGDPDAMAHPTAHLARPLDTAAAEVLSRIAAEPDHHPPRDWLTVLSADAAALVARRMVADGSAIARPVRRGLRREVITLPVDPIAAAWPSARLSTGVRGHRRFGPGDVFLLGLTAATPLFSDLFVDSTPHMREAALAQQDRLPKPWLELLEITRLAVASGVMTHRT